MELLPILLASIIWGIFWLDTFLVAMLMSLGGFGLTALRLPFWQRQSRLSRASGLVPALDASLCLNSVPRGRPLFDPSEGAAAFVRQEAEAQAAAQAAARLARAASGDLATLDELSQLADAAHQQEAQALLAALFAHAQTHTTALPALARNVLQRKLRPTAQFVAAAWQHWQAVRQSDDKAMGNQMMLTAGLTLAEILHLAAQSDDATCFQQTAQQAMDAWRAGQLSAAESRHLGALLESSYWTLAQATRAGGAGFVLKQWLLAARRELQTAARASAAPRPQ